MEHYLDYAATAPVLPEAVRAAAACMEECWGNPSSAHRPGRRAAELVRRCREEVAGAMGCAPEELVFTSGGSEGNNWAITAGVHLGRHKGRHIITSVLEHDAVLQPCQQLGQQGYEVTFLRPDAQGRITPDLLSQALREDTVLVSLMLVNNELGTVTDIPEMARRIRAAQAPALLHCDAVQGFLKQPQAVASLGADLVSVSGHKVGAPKGIGALYLRRGIPLEPMIRGGGQEGGLRSGTEPTPLIAAFAAAVCAEQERLPEHLAQMAELKQQAQDLLRERLPELVFLGGGEAPHILPISLPGYPSEVLLRFLNDRDIYVSSGSACHRGKPSHVFAALPVTAAVRMGALRLSFSPRTTQEDIEALALALCQARDTLTPMR